MTGYPQSYPIRSVSEKTDFGSDYYPKFLKISDRIGFRIIRGSDRKFGTLASVRNHCIILFDLNLNQLKQFGPLGAGNNQLKCPVGLCCNVDFLYICDYRNKRIQILTLDFDYVYTIQLGGNFPRRVQISNTTIGVSCDQATLFYDLFSKALKYKHNIAGTYAINPFFDIV